MLATLIRKYSRISIDQDALQVYKELDSNLAKLSNLTGIGWDAVATNFYNFEITATLFEGIAIGAGIVTVILILNKNKIRNLNTASNEDKAKI